MFERHPPHADQGVHPGLPRPADARHGLRHPLHRGAGDRLRREHGRAEHPHGASTTWTTAPPAATWWPASPARATSRSCRRDRRRPADAGPARPRHGADRRCGSTTASRRTCGPGGPRPSSSSSTAPTRTRRASCWATPAGSPRNSSQQVLVDRFTRQRGAELLPGRARSADPRLVQREPGEPQLHRARRDRDRGQPDGPALDEHGRGPREGDRHDRADHRHADHARWSSSSARRCRSR